MFGGSDDEDAHGHTTSLTINKKFAKDFESQKRREELSKNRHVLEDDEESDSESEESDVGEVSPQMDLEIFKTIASIKNKDPSIYDTSKQWFNDDEASGSGDEGSKASRPKKTKPKYYKDVVAEQLLAADKKGKLDAASDEDSEDEDMERGGDGKASYVEEQAALKRSFLQTVEAAEKDDDEGEDDADDEDEDGNFLTLRSKSDAEVKTEEAEFKEFMEEEEKKLEQEKGDEVKNEKFLLDYFKNKKWAEDDEVLNYDNVIGGEDGELDEDLEDVEAAEEFELKYNFRFEEQGGGEITGHSRQMAHSVRRADTRRKSAREERKLRKQQERETKEKELRRLKNLKRQELTSRLSSIRKMAGAEGDEEGGWGEDIDLEGDFDPAAHDAKMAAMFDDQYYDADDATAVGAKPTWDDEGEDEAYPPIDMEEEEEGEEEGEGEWVEGEGAGEDGEWGEGEEEGGGEERVGRKRGRGGGADEDELEEAAREEGRVGAAARHALDELHALDYEDLIGDIPCRFKYRKVDADGFGLTTKELLHAPDSDLSSYVSLKKLTPYREGRWKVPSNQKKHFKQMVRRQYIKKAEEEEEEERKRAEEAEEKKKKKKKTRGKKKGKEEQSVDGEENENSSSSSSAALEEGEGDEGKTEKAEKKKKKKDDGSGEKKKKKSSKSKKKLGSLSKARMESYGL